MTEFDKLTVEDVEAIAGADDPDAMDRNARGAADLWSAYEYAKSSFGAHIEELRQYWSGAVAQRFAEEAQVVHADVDEMGTVLQAHTDALPVVAETMRGFKTDAKSLADEYRAKRAQHEKEPPEKALPAIAELDREYGEKSRARLIEANDTYHRYNNGYLAPPKEFRGVLPDHAQPQLQAAPGPTAPAAPPPVTGAPPTSPFVTNPAALGNTLLPPPMTGLPVRPVTALPPPVTSRSVMGTPGPGAVRNLPTAMPRSSLVTGTQPTARAVPRVGPVTTIPAQPRPGVVRPVTMVTGGSGPGMVARPPLSRTVASPPVVAGRSAVPGGAAVTGRTVPGVSSAAGRSVVPGAVNAGRGRPLVQRGLTSPLVATGRAPVPGRHPASVVVPRALAGTSPGQPIAAGTAPERTWTRSPLVRAAAVPASAPAAPAPQAEPEPRWTRDPRVRPAPPAAEPRPVPEPRRPEWGRTPWVRPATGSAVYPARVEPAEPEPEPPSTSSEADEPLLNPVTLSRLLSEATPVERERLLAVETAKLERIRAERAAKPAAE